MRHTIFLQMYNSWFVYLLCVSYQIKNKRCMYLFWEVLCYVDIQTHKHIRIILKTVLGTQFCQKKFNNDYLERKDNAFALPTVFG